MISKDPHELDIQFTLEFQGSPPYIDYLHLIATNQTESTLIIREKTKIDANNSIFMLKLLGSKQNNQGRHDEKSVKNSWNT